MRDTHKVMIVLILVKFLCLVWTELTQPSFHYLSSVEFLSAVTLIFNLPAST
jgi:hypothetical protein